MDAGNQLSNDIVGYKLLKKINKKMALNEEMMVKIHIYKFMVMQMGFV